MSRKSDRKHIFNLVYQLEFNSHDTDDKTDELVGLYFNEMTQAKPEAYDKGFIVGEFLGTKDNIAVIDAKIGEFAEGWSVERFSKVDLAIMRLAVYEIMFVADIPKSVSINEAVELAKEFSTDESPMFINGILGKIDDMNK